MSLAELAAELISIGNQLDSIRPCLVLYGSSSISVHALQ